MGQAGLKRAKEVYDWSVIYKQYQELWSTLKLIRQDYRSQTLNSKSWPGRTNPFQGFSTYATNHLSLDSRISLVDMDVNNSFERFITINNLKMVSFASFILPTKEEVKNLFNNLIGGPVKVSDLLISFDVNRRPFIFRILVWLVKMNFIKLVG